ncbi:MAG: hypothetical protein SV775_17080, partial [Thermodesulfobacteriota bacterium]|nr:hypothetical protein [Thermodesulfobacteriota bacterium]
MARRAGKIKEIREMHRNVLVLDCGDAFRVKGKFPELWTEAVLAGLDLIGYDAVNVGEVELALGTRFFNEMTMKMTVPFVSANLSDSNGRLSRVKTYVIKEFDSIRVGVTGVTPTVFFKDEILKEDGIVVNSPLKALRQVLKELREKTDIIILLSHLGYKGTKDFLEYNDFSGIDVVVAGHGRKLLNKPEKVNGTLVVQNSMGGEYLGRLMLTLGPDGSIRRFE